MMPTKLAPAGLLSLVAAGLGGVAYSKHVGAYPMVDKITILGAVALAVIGGALSLAKLEYGAPIAAGAVTVFIAVAASLAGARVDVPDAFHTLEAKLLLGAGVVGIIVAVIVSIDLFGRVNTPLGAAIAVLSLVSPIALGAIIHIDDAHTAPQIAAIVGQLLVAIVIIVGALKGPFGGAASLVAAGLLLPHWIVRVQDFEDRKAAALAAVLSVGLIMVLAIILLILAGATSARIRAAEAAEGDPALITADWRPVGGAVAPTPVGVVIPGHIAPPSMAQPRVGAVVQPVSAPMTPVAVPTNGQWAIDPYGRYQVRYWNGKKWTHHVATNGITGSDPIEEG